MAEINVQNDLTLANETPEVASTNMNDASLIGVNPDAYADGKEQFQPSVEMKKSPAMAQPQVAKKITSGRSIASVMKPNVSDLNTSEEGFLGLGQLWGKTKKRVDYGADLREMNDLGSKWLSNGQLKGREEAKYNILKNRTQKFTQDNPDYSADFLTTDYFSTLPFTIADVVTDQVRGLINEAPIIGGATAAGAAAGGLSGLVVGGPAGAGAAAVTGGVSGLATGVKIAQAVDSFKQTRGSVANDLRFAVNPKTNQPLNLPSNVVSQVANGTAALVAGFDALSFSTVTKGAKWIRQSLRMSSAEAALKLAGKVASTPAEQMKLSVIRKLGHIGATEGGTEALQEVFQQLGTAVGQSWNGNEMQFWNAASRVSDQYYKDIKTLSKTGKLTGNLRGTVESAVVGSVAGPATSTALGLVTAPIPSVVGKIRNKKAAQPTIPATTERNPGMPLIEKGQKAIEAKVVLDELVKLTGKTELQKLQPGEMSDLVKNQATGAGIPFMWSDPEAMQKWAGKDEKKQKAVERILGGRGREDMQINAPFKIDTHLIVETMREFPDFSDQVKPDSNGVTFGQLNQLQQEIKQRQEQVLKQPIKQKEATNEDDAIIETVATREQADEFIKSYSEGVKFVEDKIAREGGAARPDEVKFIDDQNRLIKKLQNQRTFLPTQSELDGGTQLGFEEQFDRKKGLEAQNVTLTPESTDDEIMAQLVTQESAQAYLNRLDKNLVDEMAKSDDDAENPKVAEIQALKARVQTIMEGLPSETEGTDPNTAIQEAIGENRPDFLIPPELRAALPQEDVHAIEAGEAAARDFTVEEIQDAATNEMLKVTDIVEENAVQAEADILEDSYSTNPNIQIVENFINSKDLAPDIRQSLVIAPDLPKTAPAYAINPYSLTDAQSQLYLADQNLKDRKVFHKKGISAQEAANILGISDVNQMLQILSQTPTKEQAITKTLERREMQIASEAAESVDLDSVNVIKRLDDRNAINAKVLDVMRSTKEGWKGLKSAIRTVAFPTPKSADIRAQARATVYTDTKINELDRNQYRIGENRSRKKSAEALVKGDLESAFLEKQSEMHNVELQRATLQVTAEVNRRVKKLGRLLADRNIERLQRAGQTYLDAHIEVTDLFNLDPRVEGQGQANSWVQMAEAAVEAGQGDLRIPPGVLDSYDPRMPWNQLTPEQFIYVVDKLDNLSKLAEQKNTYVGEYKRGILAMNEDMMEATIDAHARANPAFNSKKALKSELREFSIVEKVGNALSNVSSILLSNTQYITLEFDNGQVDGFLQDVIWNRIQGTGKWEGPYGARARDTMRADIRSVWQSEIKEYGSSKFANMGTEKIDVPEFKGIDKLNNGKMRKIDLFVMAHHLGNDSNFSELTKFGVAPETIWAVMERELTLKDMTFIQNSVWNVFTSLQDRVVALEKLDNQDIELIKPREFTFKGKTFPGGYFHITRENLDGEATKQDKLLGMSWSKFIPNYAARGMTAQGYTEARVENEKLISISPVTISFGFEEVTNDLAMRVPVRDTYKILTNKNIRKSIVSVVGENKLKIMQDAISSQTRSDDARRMYSQIHGEAYLQRMISKIGSLEAIATLAGNLTSILIQPVSLLITLERMGGPKAIKHFTGVAGKMAAPWNYGYWPQAYQFAADMDHGIENYRQGIDDHLMAGISDLVPERGGTKVGNMIGGARDFTIERLMGLMGAMDVSVKSITALASYSQFMAGEAPGFDMARISAMTESERQVAARQYASTISSLSLTQGSELHKSNFQRSILGTVFGRYFNDARNAINSSLQSNRDVTNNIKDAVALAKDGQLEASANKFSDTGSKVVQMVIMTAAAALYESAIRGRLPEDEEEITPTYVIDQLVTQRFVQNFPGLRDVKFGMDSGRPPSVPLYRTLENVGIGVSGFASFAYNYVQYMNAVEAAQELTPKELKAMLSTTSYLLGGAPVNGPWKWSQAIISEGEDKTTKAESTFLGAAALLYKQMHDFIVRNQDKPEMKEIVEQVTQDLLTIPGVEAYQGVTTEDLAAMRMAESSDGPWDTTNEYTGAFGKYQILPSTWKDIVSRAPKSLGLTKIGLYNKDGKQAEAGAKWYADDIARQLVAAKKLPTLTNIYGGWHFGAAGWLKIINAAPKAKKDTVLSDSAMNANPWTQKASIKTAGDVVGFLRKYIGNARLKALSTEVADN